MELNPECQTLLALQLASPERYNSALINQFEIYKAKYKEYPRTVIFDFARNEENQNVESVYATLENIKNGRLDSSFFGKCRRIRFKPPHVFVFTNTVPNMLALSSDRYSLNVITSEEYNFAALKCTVELVVTESTRGLVSWYYSAKIADLGEQEKSKKILSTSLILEISEVLGRLDGAIYRQTFDGDIHTTTLIKAPEYVQRVINLRSIK